MRTIRLVVGVVENVQKECSHCSALRIGKEAKIPIVIACLREAEGHAEAVFAAQVREKVGWQVKSHALSVEEAETAIAPVERLHWYPMPVILLVLCTVASTGCSVRVVVETLSLAQPHSTAQGNAEKSGFDSACDFLS